MLKIKFSIMNKSWTLRLLEKKKFKKKHGEGFVGMAVGDRRRIDLHPGGFDLETIVHELTHAYRTEMCLESTSEMTPGDIEEFYCELMAKRGKELIQLADYLYSEVVALTTPNTDQVYPK